MQGANPCLCMHGEVGNVQLNQEYPTNYKNTKTEETKNGKQEKGNQFIYRKEGDA